MSPQDKLLKLYELLPFERHPLWRAVIEKRLTYEQVIQAEIQHYLRSSRSRGLRAESLGRARNSSKRVFDLMLATFLEECTDREGTNHLDLIKRLVIAGGIGEADLESYQSTAGNIAAISLYNDIARRGPEHHMIGAGVVEYYYSLLCPKIFEVYTGHYGMTAEQAETYYIHGPMDQEHAARALEIVDEAIARFGFESIEAAVRDALVATSLHYDGMLEAATGQISYWSGK